MRLTRNVAGMVKNKFVRNIEEKHRICLYECKILPVLFKKSSGLPAGPTKAKGITKRPQKPRSLHERH